MQSAQQKILTLIIIALLTISCTQKQQPEQTLPKQKPAVTKKEPIAPKPQIPTEQTTKSEMITIPSGKFIMGCKPSEKTCTKNEKHHSEIELSEYQIDKYEVTIANYEKCIDAGACNNSDLTKKHYGTNSDYNKCDIGSKKDSNLPANCISWFGADAYCKWQDKQLPTEAQWEKAARGDDGRSYPWGDADPKECDKVVMGDESGNGCGTESSFAAGSKEADKSPYGVFDMAGNVKEWTSDYYDKHFYKRSAKTDPTVTNKAKYRSVRGGAFTNHMAASFMISKRSYFIPVNWDSSIGFRCAK